MTDDPYQFRQQSEIIRHIRNWFWERHFVEVDTLIRVPSPALEEHLMAYSSEDLFLHTSPEFAMKKMISTGLHRIFQCAHCFRKEELGVHHNSEFRMLEWYQVGISLSDFLEQTLEFLRFLCTHVQLSFPKVHFVDATSVLPNSISEEEWFFRWVDEIEPTFSDITVVYPYPSWQAALARVVHNKAQRFEIYWNGIELANAFDEESSIHVLRNRWQKNNNYRKENNLPEHPIDESFLQAMTYFPRCCGIALGIDRLLMILLQKENIHQLRL